MPKPVQRYDIYFFSSVFLLIKLFFLKEKFGYLPLRYNDGREIENEKFLQLAVHEVTAERSEHDELIERFGGITLFLLFLMMELFFLKEKFGYVNQAN